MKTSKQITIKRSIIAKLDKIRESTKPQRSYSEAIEYLLENKK